MPSPFPGMDPFLEINPRWEGFHAWFVRKLAEQSLPKAQELGCWIDVERMVYQREPSGEVVLIGGPDETVAADPSAPEWHSSAAGCPGRAQGHPRGGARPGHARAQSSRIIWSSESWGSSPASWRRWRSSVRQTRAGAMSPVTARSGCAGWPGEPISWRSTCCEMATIPPDDCFPNWRRRPISSSSPARPAWGGTKRAIRCDCRIHCP